MSYYHLPALIGLKLTLAIVCVTPNLGAISLESFIPQEVEIVIRCRGELNGYTDQGEDAARCYPCQSN